MWWFKKMAERMVEKAFKEEEKGLALYGLELEHQIIGLRRRMETLETLMEECTGDPEPLHACRRQAIEDWLEYAKNENEKEENDNGW